MRHDRWFPLIWRGSPADSIDANGHPIQSIYVGQYNEQPAISAKYYIVFDGWCDARRMPYPIPPRDSGSGTPQPTLPELLTLSGFDRSNDWTIAMHIAFPEDWDSYLAASVEASWPLFSIIGTDAGNRIDVRMLRNTDTNPDPVNDPTYNFRRPQSIQASITIGDTPAGTITLDQVFYAHAGSPIWIAITQSTSEARISLCARVGGGDRPVQSNIGALVGIPAELHVANASPNPVTPLMLFAVMADANGRTETALRQLLVGSLLITGSDT